MPHVSFFARIGLAVLLAMIILPFGAAPLPAPNGMVTSYIVQADSPAAAAAEVASSGGVVVRELALIDAVAAELSPAALARLHNRPGLRLHPDKMVRTSQEEIGGASTNETDTAQYLLHPAAAVAVTNLHSRKVWADQHTCANKRVEDSGYSERDLRGSGVTVAVIDTGFIPMQSSGDWKYKDASGTLIAENSGHCIIYRDFVNPGAASNSSDPYGHGTHVATTIVNRSTAVLKPGANASPLGVAPDVNLLIARALGPDGSGSYSNVIAAIEWVIANQDTYNVRVLNLSLYSPVTGPYWADPLNQAVMRAWQEGIVVVVAAGNGGPGAATIGSPGNVPYVITVGSMRSGRYTTSGYDELADYSARGPTESAFVKPDLVVPASMTIAPMPLNSALAMSAPADRKVTAPAADLGVGAISSNHAYYKLSGTSMAAAEVSGIVALMIQKNSWLDNNQVKYRLMSTARLAVDPATGSALYTIWEQGNGLVRAENAIYSYSGYQANLGLDLEYDLDPTADPDTDPNNIMRYWGNTVWDEASGEFRLVNPWTGQYMEFWAGGQRSWAGSRLSWAGGQRSWAGGDPLFLASGTLSWATGQRSWAGGQRSWAGGQRSWAGGQLQSGDMIPIRGDIIVDDEVTLAAPTRFVIYLPLIQH